MSNSKSAEAYLLGSVLQNNSLADEVLSKIHPKDFEVVELRKIYEECLRLWDEGKPIDVVTLSSVSDPQTLSNLVGSGNPYKISGYIDIVKNHSIKRELNNLGHYLQAISQENKNYAELMDSAEKAYSKISKEHTSDNIISFADLARDFTKDLVEKYRNPQSIVGQSTGYNSWDKYISGFKKQDLVIIAGRPAMGKTALGLNMALRQAIKKELPVGFFSLEMSKEQLMTRAVSTWGRIEAKKLGTGHMSAIEAEQAQAALRTLKQTPIYLDDTPGISILELKRRARKMVKEHGVKCLFVDYLTLIKIERMGSRDQEVTEIAKGLKSIARECQVPVVALAQLSRKCEMRDDKRPLLSDLRESGGIEQEADLIGFVYRDSVYDENASQNSAEILFRKNRHGATGKVNMCWNGAYTSFDEICNA